MWFFDGFDNKKLMNEKLEFIFLKRWRSGKTKIVFETVYGVSSFTVAASFNRSKQCSQLYMYSVFEKNDGG